MIDSTIRAMTAEEIKFAGHLCAMRMEHENIDPKDWEFFGGLTGPTRKGTPEYDVILRNNVSGQVVGIKIAGHLSSANIHKDLLPFCSHPNNRIYAHKTIKDVIADPLNQPKK